MQTTRRDGHWPDRRYGRRSHTGEGRPLHSDRTGPGQPNQDVMR